MTMFEGFTTTADPMEDVTPESRDNQFNRLREELARAYSDDKLDVVVMVVDKEKERVSTNALATPNGITLAAMALVEAVERFKADRLPVPGAVDNLENIAQDGDAQ